MILEWFIRLFGAEMRKIKGIKEAPLQKLSSLFGHCQFRPGVSGNDFWTLEMGTGIAQPIPKFLGMGTGMKNSFHNFWEREWKTHSQFLGTGMGMENSIPDFREREWDIVIPGNDWERE